MATSGMKRIVFVVVLLLTLVTNASRAHPQSWYSDSKVLGQNATNSEDHKGLSTHFATRRKILSHRNYASNVDDIASKGDGKIIFPSDDRDTLSPQIPDRPKADCENSTYCENTVNYPSEFLQTALRANKDLKLFSSVDLVPDVVHRVNTQPEDSPLCEATEKVVYPKVAQSKDKEWLFVVNQEGFTQGVRVETCGKENNACNLIEGFAEGYKTTCKQKYIYRQLVALSPIGQLKPEKFRFPASCCCHIKFTGNPLGPRMGSSLGKKAPELPTAKANRKK